MAAALLLAVTGFVKAQEAANPAAYITFSEAVIPQGGTGEMEVYYTVDNSQLFKAFQINVSFSEEELKGITIEKVEMNSFPANITKGDYKNLSEDDTYDPASKFFATSKVKDGKNVVIGFQTGNMAFPATATTEEKTLLCTLTLKAAESVATNYTGYSSSTDYIELTSSSDIKQNDTKVMVSQNQNLTIKVFKKGDVNGDGEVDLADAVCVINHIHSNNGQNDDVFHNDVFYESMANVNQDEEGIDLGDVVSIINIIHNTGSSQHAPKAIELLLDPQ